LVTRPRPHATRTARSWHCPSRHPPPEAAAGGTAHVRAADLSKTAAIDDVVACMLADHPAIDFLVNNAGRSIRRSIKLSEDRFHDFERTMQLLLGAI
jgi:NAD(P)-dependent dehydrogenase (short-subunit alcohol dehydrogenase family)